MGGRPIPSPEDEARANARRLDFRPDPTQVMSALDRLVEVAPAGPAPRPGALPSHVFRVLRPSDLAVFDVLAYDLDLKADDDGPALYATSAKARLEVRFAFQHLGERAFFQAGTPDNPQPGDEPASPPPIQALAAQATRLVFDVPEDERIAYDIAGVLAAMSRLALRVAPLATPRAPAARPGIGGVAGLVGMVTLPGGFTLGRTAEGQLALTSVTRDAPVRGGGPRQPPVPPPPAAPSTARSLLAQGTALRTARALLERESAIDLSTGVAAATDVRFGRPFRDLVVVPGDRRPTIRQRPRAPLADETSIEVPFRLILSPSVQGGFVHALMPFTAPDDMERVELWHTRLGVRRVSTDDGSVRIDESDHPQRVVRAVWARDKAGLAADADPPQGESPFRMSLNPLDRAVLVRQSADPAIAPPQPVDIDRLYLSALGAFVGAHGRWENTTPYATKMLKTIRSWDHEAIMGRDQYVSVVYPGYLFPFGHRCTLIKVTERKIHESVTPRATLYQRKFIVVSQPVRTFDDRRMPFRQVALRPLATPNIRDPLAAGTPWVVSGENLFWPTVGTRKFRFTLDCLDHDGKRLRFETPLLFVGEQLPTLQPNETAAKIRSTYVNDPEREIAGNSQLLSFAAGTVPGDTAFESVTLRFDGLPGPTGSATAMPFLDDADIVVPAMRHLAPAAPPSRVKFATPYLDVGFTGKNTEAQVFLELTTAATISFAQGTDKAGGFVQPDLPVRGLSRVLGAVGDIDDLVNAPAASKFNPDKFLAGVLPKLFGLFELTDILKAVGLDGAPKFVTEQLDRVAALLADIEALKDSVTRGVDRLAADATGLPTAALKAQAQAARTALENARAQLEARAAELMAAVDALLDLGAASSLGDVTAAVSGALNAIAAQVATLRSVVRDQPLPPPVKAELERLLGALEPALDAARIGETINAIAQFVNGIDPAGLALRARYDWRPTLTNFPSGTSGDDSLFQVRPDGFLLSVEARASGSDGVGVDILAELRDFALNLFPGAPLMRLGFDRLAFRAASGRKPEVDVVFRGIEFVGVLSFIETLKDLIPMDAFSDPPYVDVSPEGVVAGFSLALPSTAIGVFSLENISLGADARIPFLGNEALTVGFNFCTREKPFRLTVMMIGGGGFVGIRLSPRGLVVLEMALEAGCSLSIDLGVASGSVSVMVGVYLKLEADAGSLTGYFRIRGEVDVLGIITASITLELSLRYEFETGKMVGRASLVIEIDVFIFSGSVTVTCERRLAGSNGDPTLEQVMGVLPDGTSPAWTQYCTAFAEA
jgi:hypothetical protein